MEKMAPSNAGVYLIDSSCVYGKSLRGHALVFFHDSSDSGGWWPDDAWCR